MAHVGTVTISWRGGEDQFCLAKVGDVMAFEDKCGAGIRVVLARLLTDTWGLQDFREAIRLGLIGAGMAPDKAMTKVKLHVDGNPDGFVPSVLVAQVIVAAACFGAPKDDELGKTEAAGAETGQASTTMMAASAAAPFSESEQPLAGPQETPTTAPSGSWPLASKDTPEPTTPSLTNHHP